MSEGLKEHAWKACVGVILLPWVRIPLSPPLTSRNAYINKAENRRVWGVYRHFYHLPGVDIIGHRETPAEVSVRSTRYLACFYRLRVRFQSLRRGRSQMGIVPFVVELRVTDSRSPLRGHHITPRQQPCRQAEPARPAHRPGAAYHGSPGPAGSASPPRPARSPPSVESSDHRASA